MKKLATIALTGALTLGALATTELVKPSTQAAAAATKASDPLNDEWGITNTHILYEFISPFTPNLASQIQNGYDFNNKFHMELASTPSRPGTPDDQVKIFRVLQDGSLARYLTMNPTYKEKMVLYIKTGTRQLTQLIHQDFMLSLATLMVNT